MSERQRIAPCPFCGGEARCDTGKSAFVDAEITCLACGTTGPNFDDGDRVFNREAAITAWNTRARPEPSEAVVGLYYAIKLCAARIERPNLSPDADVVLERARAAIAAYEAERGR